MLESGVSGLPTDEFILGDMSLGTPSVASSDENYDDNLLSFFARLNYDFTDKYLFSATFRGMALLNSVRIINGDIFLPYQQHGVWLKRIL